MQENWENWMLAGEGIVDGAANEPSQGLVAEWLFDIYTSIPGQMMRNAWMKTGFE